MYLWAANCVVKGAKSLGVSTFSSREKKTKSKPEILKHGGNGGKTGGHGGFFGVGSVCPAFMCELRSYSSGLSRLFDSATQPQKTSASSGFFLRFLRVSGFLVLTLFFSCGMK
jgi:hypothetical protein